MTTTSSKGSADSLKTIQNESRIYCHSRKSSMTVPLRCQPPITGFALGYRKCSDRGSKGVELGVTALCPLARIPCITHTAKGKLWCTTVVHQKLWHNAIIQIALLNEGLDLERFMVDTTIPWGCKRWRFKVWWWIRQKLITMVKTPRCQWYRWPSGIISTHKLSKQSCKIFPLFLQTS